MMLSSSPSAMCYGLKPLSAVSTESMVGVFWGISHLQLMPDVFNLKL